MAPLNLLAVTRGAATQTQASEAIPESKAGLQSQLETILRATKGRDSRLLEDLIADLQIPEDSNWFLSTFGAELGRKLATTYQASWPAYEDILKNIFDNARAEKFGHVSANEFLSASITSGESMIGSILKVSKVPLSLYTASAHKGRTSGALPGVYIYVQGRFRIVNWRTFYDVPNVKPVRIRVSAEVAQAQLIRQFDPVYPEEARQQQVQGKVMLHVIVDRDGTVASAQVVSGPAELGKAAVDAVKQWLFRPTLLNGDPVEVDTTLTITFSLAH